MQELLASWVVAPVVCGQRVVGPVNSNRRGRVLNGCDPAAYFELARAITRQPMGAKGKDNA